ncbi:MAG: hypothetical protein WB771_08710, partial [Solirubrobacterales bacterium]
MKPAGMVLGIAAVAALLPTATAYAVSANRYVDAVTGINDMDPNCTAPPPADGCDIEHAVENVAGTGDIVHVAPGDYALPSGNGLEITKANLQVLGPGPGQATLSSSSSVAGIYVNEANITVSGLGVEYNGAGVGLGFGTSSTGSVADQLSVNSSSGASACRIDTSGTVTARNSVCHYTGKPERRYPGHLQRHGAGGRPLQRHCRRLPDLRA